jgi:hypothetical protein
MENIANTFEVEDTSIHSTSVVAGDGTSPEALRDRLIQSALDNWKSRLIDTSRRNVLLYYRRSKTMLPVTVGPEVLRRLIDGKSVLLRELIPGEALVASDFREMRRKARENSEEKGLEASSKRGEISAARSKKVGAIIEGALDRYVGSTQVHQIGDELWGGYLPWRRENGVGSSRLNGVREISEHMAQTFAKQEAERRTKTQQALGIRILKPIQVKSSAKRTIPLISDSTIRLEMSIF